VERFLYILNIALEAVFANKVRSMLTALGIIFGVAAVIAMLAIGTGAKQEILNQIKLVGVNNIIISPKNIKSKTSNKDDNSTSKNVKDKYSPGLTLKDAESIKKIIPGVKLVSPEVIYKTFIINNGVRKQENLIGITPDFFNIFNLSLEKGLMFSQTELKHGKAVCIIGSSIKSRFFPKQNPVGEYIKCGNIWLKVIGVLNNRNVSQKSAKNLGISNYNNSIFAPIQTLLLRFKDRSVINSNSVNGGGNVYISNGFSSVSFSNDDEAASSNNQIDKIVVQVKESDFLAPTTEVLHEMLKRRHYDVDDVEIIVPELLLKQEQKTKDIFNVVLGAIASISLIVGGIGIMNIMLASVLERIKEIGVRMAVGATKKDISLQFIIEATLISLTGGIIGIILGFVLAKIITQTTGILTIISPMSIIISFGVSASIGIIFGYMPAKKAAEQDPVTSLRYE